MMGIPAKATMLPGYNHNVTYKGVTFHIQTEDSGTNNPHIITLLYSGGNILARKKTSYADIIKHERLSDVVRELMQEQHKLMLRDLKNGSFDNHPLVRVEIQETGGQARSRSRGSPARARANPGRGSRAGDQGKTGAAHDQHQRRQGTQRYRYIRRGHNFRIRAWMK